MPNPIEEMIQRLQDLQKTQPEIADSLENQINRLRQTLENREQNAGGSTTPTVTPATEDSASEQIKRLEEVQKIRENQLETLDLQPDQKSAIQQQIKRLEQIKQDLIARSGQ
ncbi:hypothetical protein [Longirhabdus pacifica]|uniref:hypothetical protein n=1 Tax=Longirhabdus pacifica TaxID=2305227 RepID=UPI001008755A|nr:hypothetical protein [Longirhabdus pacifica]